MTQEFWIVIGLLAVVAIASIHLVYKWGRRAEYEKWTDEFIEDFKATYLEKLTEAFQIKVEERAKQLAALMLAEKEIDNEDTRSS
jgi:hypothetical protein